MSLSDRIRPNCEAAPWVVEEVKKLERENAALREALSEAKVRTAETMEWRDELFIKWRAVLDAARKEAQP